MKTVTSIAGHVRSAAHTLIEQAHKLDRQEQVVEAAKRVVRQWEDGASFEDLSPLIANLTVLLVELDGGKK